MKQFNNSRNIRGQALVIVITLLGMLFVVGLAFFVLSQAERTASVRHLDSIRARYITEAGVAYGQKLLKLDRSTNLTDSLGDITVSSVSGQEVDLNGDGMVESRWFYLTDSQGNPVGRFSVKITDEASKVNFNSCSAQTLTQLFSILGIDGSKANTLISARPFNALEQTGSILGKKDFALTKNFLTVYSRDLEVDLDRKRRAYLNSASAGVILEELLSSGINNAYQKAANLKDASDEDLAQTIMDTFTLSNIMPSSLGEPGGWQGRLDFYEAPAAGAAGKFSWNNLALPDGEYYCFLYGHLNTDVVGEVDGQYVNSGEGLKQKVKIQNGSLTLEIKPAQDSTSRFSHIELQGVTYQEGLTRKVITGTEAVVINELEVRPAREISMEGFDIEPGKSINYTFSQINPGDYYVVVLAKNAAGLVGDVEIHGKSATNLRDGDYFPATVNVDGGGELSVTIKNNSLGQASFRGIKILQEPDGEFIEVLNLSPKEIDMSGFSFEVYNSDGELVPGWPGRVPAGTKIGSYQHLVFAVDNSDVAPTPPQLRGNGICFQKTWGFNNVGLAFEEFGETIDKTFDLLPDNGGRVILKDAASRQVDAVEYLNMQINDFVSLERGDPTAKMDSDGDGFFDGWYNSESKKQATPASANENIGMYTLSESGAKIKHSVNECAVFNQKLANLSEVEKVSGGQPWKKFIIADMSKMADHFAYAALELQLAGHYQAGDFKEIGGVFESERAGQSGVWEFPKVHTGSYLLSIASQDLNTEGHKIQVSYKLSGEEDFKDNATILFAQGIAWYGRVELSGENLCTFSLKIINDSENKLTLQSIRLEPIYSVDGRINVNTASPQVLQSLFNNDSLVQTIIDRRPIGVTYGAKLGVGELFILNPAYLSFHDNLTVKSDIYEIISRGEYYQRGNTLAYQLIRTVVERGD